jgi:RNA polymerase sigma factor (sigma-70 family)
MDEDAEDLVQEACTTVFEKYRNETFDVGFHAWACGVLRMKIGNYLHRKHRNSQRSARLTDRTEDRSPGSTPGLQRALIDCLKRLLKKKPRYARILNFSHQGYTTNQICERLKMNSNQYYVALNRSRSLMKACLQQMGVVR